MFSHHKKSPFRLKPNKILGQYCKKEKVKRKKEKVSMLRLFNPYKDYVRNSKFEYFLVYNNKK